MTYSTPAQAPPAERSTFVTVVAWIFIVASGFGTFVAAAQNVLARFMTGSEFERALHDSSFTNHLPQGMSPAVEHFRLLALVGLIVAAGTLVAAVGLLHRHNWARRMLISILALGIAYILGSLVLQRSFVRFGVGGSVRNEVAQEFRIMFITLGIMGIGVSVLFGWIIARLSSRSVRTEFALEETR